MRNLTQQHNTSQAFVMLAYNHPYGSHGPIKMFMHQKLKILREDGHLNENNTGIQRMFSLSEK